MHFRNLLWLRVFSQVPGQHWHQAWTCGRRSASATSFLLHRMTPWMAGEEGGEERGVDIRVVVTEPFWVSRFILTSLRYVCGPRSRSVSPVKVEACVCSLACATAKVELGPLTRSRARLCSERGGRRNELSPRSISVVEPGKVDCKFVLRCAPQRMDESAEEA